MQQGTGKLSGVRLLAADLAALPLLVAGLVLIAFAALVWRVLAC